MQDNSLQEFNQVLWQFGINESLHSNRDFLDVLCLWKSSLHDLFNYILSVWVLGVKNFGPQLWFLSFNEIACLSSIKISFICNFNEFFITFAPSSLVSSESKIWIAVFTIFTNNFTIVELVLDQEFLRILLTSIDVDFGQGIVKCGFLRLFIESVLEPSCQNP